MGELYGCELYLNKNVFQKRVYVKCLAYNWCSITSPCSDFIPLAWFVSSNREHLLLLAMPKLFINLSTGCFLPLLNTWWTDFISFWGAWGIREQSACCFLLLDLCHGLGYPECVLLHWACQNHLPGLPFRTSPFPYQQTLGR